MKTKILCVEANTLGEFQDLINQVNDNHDVFATQTHVSTVNENMLHYTAVLFTRP